MEKRNHIRVSIGELSVDASDGNGFFQGMVSDVSRFGVCLKNLPKKIDERVKRITIVINGNGENFKMKVIPKWCSSENGRKTIGGEILEPPWGWTEFVMGFEPKAEDVWGEVSI